MTDWKILHCLADEGVESEALSAYGEVIRVGLDPKDTNDSIPIKADARNLPFSEDVRFDLGLFHPPCYKWTQRDSEDAENLIPLAREIAENHCDEYIIENQTDAPLADPIVLDGSMFGLPVCYERAFETSYPVKRKESRSNYQYRHRVENTRSKAYWGSVKGYSHGSYDGKTLATNSTPRCYIEWLLQPLLHNDAKPETEQSRLVV